MSIDLGLVTLIPQTGHCARAASQALLKESWERAGAARGLWLCCVGRPSLGGKKGSHPFLGIGLPPRAFPETPGTSRFSEIYFGICF